MRSPFKFLDPFELADKDVFFGRDKEVDTLYRMVYQSNLILVYGYSGTGKTSLIQCGLAGRFDGPQWHPFFIRKGEDINASTRAALAGALGEDIPEGAGLAELVEAVLDEYLSPVYLIFDQFEELFILGSYQEQEQFARDIRELLGQDLSCKVAFIIREEYLGELYQLEQALPRLFNFKLRVEPMNKLKVQEVLQSSFAAFNISLEAPAGQRLEEIIENVSLKKAGIQLPYLQVYLDMLWREDFARTYGPPAHEATAEEEAEAWSVEDVERAKYPALEFTQEEIKDFGTIEEVLPRFLEEQEGAIRRKLREKYPEAAVERETIQKVLDAFVTEEGTKRPVPFEWKPVPASSSAEAGPRGLEELIIPPRMLEKFPLENPILTTCLQALEQSRILRVREGAYELAHDSLAALIDGRRTNEQRQLNEEKVRLAGIYREWQRSGQFLSRKQLTLLEPFRDKLALEPQLQQFVQDSYAYNEAQEEARRQKRQAELEKERRLREQAEQAKQEAEEHALQAKAAKEQAEASRQQAEDNAEKAAANARQARRRTRLAWAISALALVIAGIAIWLFNLAQTATSTAEERRIAAERSDSIAQIKAEEAQLSDSIAQEKAREAVIKALEAQTSDSIARLRALEALQNLNSLGQASEEIASLLIADAKSLVYELRHEEALEKLRAAVPLNKKVDEVAKGLMEMALFYNQARKRRLALGIADTVAVLKGNGKARGLIGRARSSDQAQGLINEALSLVSSGWHQALMERYYPVMANVEGGSFCMGRSPKETGSCDTSQYALVSLKDFQLAKTETTAWQFYLFSVAKDWEMEPPSWGWEGDNPVVNVNWYDAVAYANWASGSLGLEPYYVIDSLRQDTNNLNASDEIEWVVTPKPGANGFRLPTEAEWEYAARGGVQQDTFIYSGSDSLSLVAWHWGNSDEEYGVYRTHTAAKKKANGLGLFDMSGNVWEWCWDWYGDIEPGILSDPHGPDSGSGRPLRGGSWVNYIGRVYEVAYRSRYVPYGRDYDYGFRLSQD